MQHRALKKPVFTDLIGRKKNIRGPIAIELEAAVPVFIERYECERSMRSRMFVQKTSVDTVARQRLFQEPPERVVTDLPSEPCLSAELRERDRYVGRCAARKLTKIGQILAIDPDRSGVQKIDQGLAKTEQ